MSTVPCAACSEKSTHYHDFYEGTLTYYCEGHACVTCVRLTLQSESETPNKKEETVMTETAVETTTTIDESAALALYLEDWQRDIKRINVALNDHANEYSFCEEYDRALEKLSESLTYKLESRPTDWEFSIEGEGTAELTVQFNIQIPTHIAEDDNLNNATLYSFVRSAIDNLRYGCSTEVKDVEIDVDETLISSINSSNWERA